MLVKSANAVDTRATPEDDQDDGADDEPRALVGEAVVPVADGRHGLHGEVQGREEAEVGVGAVGTEGVVQHDRRHHNEREQRGGHDGQGAVALLERDADLQPDAAGQPDGARRAVGRPGRRDAHALQLVHRAEDGDAVPGVERVVAARAHLHRLVARGHDRHGGQVPEVGAEGVVHVLSRIDGELHHREVDPGQLNGVGRPEQAGLHEGRRGQRRHVQHAAGARDPLQRMGHRRVGQLDHEGEVRADLLDPQCRLERVDLVDLHADHGRRPRQAGLFESFAPVGMAPDMGDAPVVEGPPAPGIGVVVDHDDLGTAEGELLHGAQPDALQAADDHMALHVLGVHAIHQRMLSVRIGAEVAAALNVDVLAQRGLEPPWGCSSVVRAGDS